MGGEGAGRRLQLRLHYCYYHSYSCFWSHSYLHSHPFVLHAQRQLRAGDVFPPLLAKPAPPRSVPAASLRWLSRPERLYYTANPQTKSLEFQGFDSVRFLIFRMEFPGPKREFPRNLDSDILTLWILSMWTGRN